MINATNWKNSRNFRTYEIIGQYLSCVDRKVAFGGKFKIHLATTMTSQIKSANDLSSFHFIERPLAEIEEKASFISQYKFRPFLRYQNLHILVQTNKKPIQVLAVLQRKLNDFSDRLLKNSL